MTFTARPEIRGTFGVATSTRWMASAVGMRLLELGGSAFDAAAGMGFVLNVVEPHLNGPLGDMPALIRLAGADIPTVICGQGVAPSAATIDHFMAEGLDMVSGSGLLATVVPGAFDAWMLMLHDHGRLPLRDVLEPAIHYARHGYPVLPRVAVTIAGLGDFFRDEWPTYHATWLPGGSAPEPGSLFKNPVLADMWERLLREAETASGREAHIEAPRRAFLHQGFVAEAIDDWMRDACVMNAAGARRRGVLTGDDMARWTASYETLLEVDYEGWRVWKCGFWSQGPSLLQSLRILDGSGIAEMDMQSTAFIHLVTEAMKLSFADRETYYGDPLHTEIPMETLLSRNYAEGRRDLLGASASHDQRPGRIAGHEDWADATMRRASQKPEAGPGVGAGEPTMAHLTERRGDIVHIDVIDRWGNSVSATPSGG